MINVSPTAASKINELLAEENKTGSGLRVFVQGGGCSGFQYGLMIEEAGGAGDQVFESNGVRLFVDPVSVSYLKGAEVDFSIRSPAVDSPSGIRTRPRRAAAAPRSMWTERAAATARITTNELRRVQGDPPHESEGRPANPAVLPWV